MKLLLIVIICFFLFLWPLIVAEQYENRKHDSAFRKKWKQEMMIRYRVYITHNNGSIIVRTLAGDNCSDILDKVINSSIKEEGDSPNRIIIKEDVIYL